MRISVKTEEVSLSIPIPDWLLFGPLGAKTAASALKKYTPEVGQRLTEEALHTLLGALKKARDTYGTWDLVEVFTADGVRVKITL